MSSAVQRATRREPDLSVQKFPWGVHPQLLLEQVKNTAGFAFEGHSESLSILRGVQDLRSWTLPNYFALCLAAHHTTVATFIPTDLDQTIRLKLWQLAAPDEREAMKQTSLKFLDWSEQEISRRWLFSPSGRFISGHQGEFLSVLGASLGNSEREEPLNSKILDAVRDLFFCYERAFGEWIQAGDWRSICISAALVSHNLGDFDRAMDLWKLPVDHAFRAFYKVGHQRKKEYENIFRAGFLNRELISRENHRHFPLRKIRGLRQSGDFLIGIGPFFDTWGATIIQSAMDESEKAQIVDGLVDGWMRLNEKEIVLGYARALKGMQETRGRQFSEILRGLPKAKQKVVLSGKLPQAMLQDQESFEASYFQRAKKLWKNL